ncbi:LIMR family protein At5g01460-like [Camellia sinensis]|uniref:LIMR family protein At5g01460-like n=1 Tax=Camellia sinensis TaxID=4442 RepID=UPI001035B88C|nr:LIMR family protein At5g01460-like [Camellia sinensis]
MGDFNLALVIVAIVVCVLVFFFNVYLLINFQHPDDANQAYFPKFVVVLGLSVAAISILMLPADVANRQACQHAIYNGACNLTLPMKSLWLAVYILDAVLVFFVIPFAMFYYEGDQDKTIGKRIKSALLWVGTTAIVCGLVLGILYEMKFVAIIDYPHPSIDEARSLDEAIVVLWSLDEWMLNIFDPYHRWGATLMNSFLFNVGLILLCSISVIQFCATSFAYYAQATAAQEIFGHTLQSLRGIKYLYKYNVFQIAFIALAGLTFVLYAAFGWKRKKPSGRFQLSA